MNTWFKRLFARASSTKKQQTQGATPAEIPCQEVVELITDYLENALLPEKRAQLEAHLVNCDGCMNYLEQVRLTIGMLRTLAQEPAFPDTREELLQTFRQMKNG